MSHQGRRDACRPGGGGRENVALAAGFIGALVALFGSPAQATLPAPFQPLWAEPGRLVFEDTLLTPVPPPNWPTSQEVADDQMGGVYVLAQHKASDPSWGILRLKRLGPDGQTFPGWPPSGVTLVEGHGSIAWNLRAISLGPQRVAVCVNRTVANVGDSHVLWIVESDPAPRIHPPLQIPFEWQDGLSYSLGWQDRFLVPLADGGCYAVLGADGGSGPQVVKVWRHTATGAVHPAWPPAGRRIEAPACSANVCNSLTLPIQLRPILLPDSSLLITTTQRFNSSRPFRQQVRSSRVTPTSEIIGSVGHSFFDSAMRPLAHAVDAHGRLVWVVESLVDPWFGVHSIVQDWNGTVLRRERLRAALPGSWRWLQSSAVRLAADRDGGVWSAFLDLRDSSSTPVDLVIAHHPFGAPSVRTVFPPIERESWFTSASDELKLVLMVGRQGDAVVALGAMPSGEGPNPLYNGPLPRLQRILRDGRMPPGPLHGVPIPGARTVALNQQDEVYALSHWLGLCCFERLVLQRLRADEATAVRAALARARWSEEGLTLEWQVSGTAEADLHLEVVTPGSLAREVPIRSVDGRGRLVAFDPGRKPDMELEYRLLEGATLLDTWRWSPQTPQGLALKAPALGSTDWSVFATLTGRAPARLEVFDVGGRMVERHSLAAGGPATHRIPLGRHLAPGLHWLRLVEGDGQVHARVTLMR